MLRELSDPCDSLWGRLLGRLLPPATGGGDSGSGSGSGEEVDFDSTGGCEGEEAATPRLSDFAEDRFLYFARGLRGKTGEAALVVFVSGEGCSDLSS